MIELKMIWLMNGQLDQMMKKERERIKIDSCWRPVSGFKCDWFGFEELKTWLEVWMRNVLTFFLLVYIADVVFDFGFFSRIPYHQDHELELATRKIVVSSLPFLLVWMFQSQERERDCVWVKVSWLNLNLCFDWKVRNLFLLLESWLKGVNRVKKIQLEPVKRR